MSATIGIGLVGAGPVVQAIHLPTLARLTDRFHVASVFDVSTDIAERVATRVQATATTDFTVLLDDPAVEVVAICSPPKFHADQVIAAMRAGKRAVLCEKPLATTIDEAQRIAEVAAETGVPLIVGAMHTFDPAWLGVLAAAPTLRETAHTVRSSIVLPFNDRFEDWSTDILERPGMPAPGDLDATARAELIVGAVLGLAIHDLPLVRSFLPDHDTAEVIAAVPLDPFGYAISVIAGDRVVELTGAIQAHWEPRWELDVIADNQVAHIDFTPSFVHAGSGTATVSSSGGRVVHLPSASHNGYEGEWRAIDAILHGDDSLRPDLDDLIADLRFAVDIAEKARTAVLAGTSEREGASA